MRIESPAAPSVAAALLSPRVDVCSAPARNCRSGESRSRRLSAPSVLMSTSEPALAVAVAALAMAPGTSAGPEVADQHAVGESRRHACPSSPSPVPSGPSQRRGAGESAQRPGKCTDRCFPREPCELACTRAPWHSVHTGLERLRGRKERPTAVSRSSSAVRSVHLGCWKREGPTRDSWGRLKSRATLMLDVQMLSSLALLTRPAKSRSIAPQSARLAPSPCATLCPAAPHRHPPRISSRPTPPRRPRRPPTASRPSPPPPPRPSPRRPATPIYARPATRGAPPSRPCFPPRLRLSAPRLALTQKSRSRSRVRVCAKRTVSRSAVDSPRAPAPRSRLARRHVPLLRFRCGADDPGRPPRANRMRSRRLSRARMPRRGPPRKSVWATTSARAPAQRARPRCGTRPRSWCATLRSSVATRASRVSQTPTKTPKAARRARARI